MWINRLVCRVSRRSSNEVSCRHEKSNKNRKKRETNMSRVCLKEMQATFAFACVDSPSLIQRRACLSEAAIEDVILPCTTEMTRMACDNLR
jgi:hypothetical protein